MTKYASGTKPGGCLRRMTARVGLVAAGLLLTAFAALPAAPALAQTVGTLVSNMDQTSVGSGGGQHAQPFTTGTNAAGYGLTSVELRLNSTGDNGVLVRIAPNGSGNTPDLSNSDEVITLSNPATVTALTNNTFSAPTGTQLAANTTYHVVVTGANGTSGGPSTDRTRATSEDSNPAAGWSIGDTRYARNNSSSAWTSSTLLLRLRITGTIINAAPEFASETATRSFDETVGDADVSTPADIGDEVTATDANNDTLTYSLEGPDANKFTIMSSSGQIRTKAGEKYSYETDTSYEVTVKADDNKGGTDTIDVTLDVNDVDEPPVAPVAPAVSATPGSTSSLNVNWTAPANAGRPAIDTYDLQYRQGNSGLWTAGPQDVSATNAAITSLASGTTYQVQVRATNDEGDGAWSPAGSGTTLAAIPTMSIAPASATEGSPVRFTVTLSASTTSDVTVPYTTSIETGDTATLDSAAPGGADFSAATNITLTIPANSTTAVISIPTTNDAVDEPDETFTVTLGTPTNANLGSPASATGTITDNDATPMVTLVLTPDSISENGGSSTVTATLDRASSEATTVTVSAAPVPPAVAGDFSVTANKVLTIAAGAQTSTGTVTITANDNSIAEGDKSVTVSATAANDQGATAPADKVLTITEDDGASSVVTLTVDPDSVAEGATGNAREVTVTATLDGAARSSDTAVTVSVDGGTAVAGTDFTAVSDFTVTIVAGSTDGTATFTLAPVDDNVDEPDETVLVKGTTTASGLTVVPAGGAAVTITDNDATPTVTLVLTPPSISENGGSSTVTATLDHPSSQATTVTVSAAPVLPAVAGDFSVTANKVLTIAAGATTSTGLVRISGVDNAIHTGNKSASVSGTAANGQGIVQPAAQTLTIEEDDTQSDTVTLSVNRDSVSEGATGNAQIVTVTATLNQAARPADTAVAVTVAADTAVEGTDFTAVPGFTITIDAGEASGTGTFTLAPVDDDIDEPDETVTVTGTTTASGLTVAPAGGLTVTIADNDATPTVTLVLTPDSISENGGVSTVTATLDRPSSETTTVTVSAAPVAPAVAGDFSVTANKVLTIAAGETTSTGTVTITAVDNNVSDGNRSVTVSATAANGQGATAPANKVLTITDDEVASTGVTLTVAPDSVAEGATGAARTVTVTATLDGSARPADTAVTVSVAGGTAVVGTDFSDVPDFTVTISAGQTIGTGTFTLIPLQDTIDEPDETVLVTGTTTASGLTVGPAGGAVVTLADDDAAPTVTLELTPDSISENGGVEHGDGDPRPSVEPGDDGDGVGGARGACGGGRLLGDREQGADHRGRGDDEHGGGEDHGQRQRHRPPGPGGDGVRRGIEQPGDRAAGGADADRHRR